MLLVTGGGGFVMAHVARRWLLSDPAATVVVLDRSPMDATVSAFLESELPRVTWIQADVTDISNALDARLQSSIEYVVHGAAVTSIDRLMHAAGPGRPGLDGARPSIATNVDGTVAALALAARLPKLRRLVNVSSGAVYASHSPPGIAVPEDGHVVPEGLYAITKFAGELFCQLGARDLGLPCTSVRLSGVFGPMDRETTDRVIRCAPNVTAHAAVRGQPLTVRSLEAVSDFIHADDVGDAIIGLLKADSVRFPVYNIGAGETATIGDLIDFTRELYPEFEVREVLNAPSDVATHVAYDASQRTGRWGAYDIGRIESDTGWRPTPLRESYGRYLRWLAER